MTKNKEHGVVYASIIPSTVLIVYSKTNRMCFANLTALYFTLFNKEDTFATSFIQTATRLDLCK